MGVFALLAGILMRRWWAVPAVAALWVAIEVTHGPLGFAWLALGNAGIDMGDPAAPGPLHRRLRPLVRVRHDGRRAGARRPPPAPPRVALARARCLLLVLLPRMPEARRGARHRPAGAAQYLRNRGVDHRLARPHDPAPGRAHPHRGALARPAQPPDIVVWPEVPAPFYYYEDPRFRDYVDNLARLARAYLLIGIVAHTPSGAPLNSAELISPAGDPVSRYDKVNLVPVRRVRALALRLSRQQDLHRSGRFRSPASTWWFRRSATAARSAPSSATNRSSPTSCASSPPAAPRCSSTSPTTAGSARPPPAASTSRSCACAPPKTAAGSCAPPTTASPPPSIPPAASAEPCPLYTEATSYTGFDYISTETLYTRFGDWFPLLCATIAIASLVAARIA